MKSITEELLGLISDFKISPEEAFNIREDSGCAGRRSTDHIRIESKTDQPGIDIYVSPEAQGESVYIPACVTRGNISDLVYNDFHVSDGADVRIVAGCGVHTDDEGTAQHDGIHRFFVGKGAKVLYLEKHIGVGEGNGKRVINPSTEFTIEEGGCLEIDTTQIKGVDSTMRVTRGSVKDGGRLIIREKIMTHGTQAAETDFFVDLDGRDSGADLVSRSVARDDSKQTFRMVIRGNAACRGHSACDAIIMDRGMVRAIPELTASDVDAALVHEAAIGKIAGEQLVKLMTLGLTEAEAEAKIIEGFLK